MNNKARTLLGFAAKAGRLSYGMKATVDAIKRGRACLALTACDISAKSRKEIAFFADQNAVRFCVLNRADSKTVSDAVGRKCGILSINDSGFADAFIKAHEEGGNGNDE